MQPEAAIVVSEVENGRSKRPRNLGCTVSNYRLYGLDGVRKVASAEWIEADGDEAAIEVAKERMDGHECELWQGPRLVARLDRVRSN